MWDDAEETDEWAEGQCQACEAFGAVYDLQLCASCSERLERDLIRNRDWDYSCLAFGLSTEQREALRREVIREHGPSLELLARDEGDARRQSQSHGNRRKRRKRRGSN